MNREYLLTLGNSDDSPRMASNSLELTFNCNDLSPLVKPATGTDPVCLLGHTALLAVLYVGKC